MSPCSLSMRLSRSLCLLVCVSFLLCLVPVSRAQTATSALLRTYEDEDGQCSGTIKKSMLLPLGDCVQDTTGDAKEAAYMKMWINSTGTAVAYQYTNSNCTTLVGARQQKTGEGLCYGASILLAPLGGSSDTLPAFPPAEASGWLQTEHCRTDTCTDCAVDVTQMGRCIEASDASAAELGGRSLAQYCMQWDGQSGAARSVASVLFSDSGCSRPHFAAVAATGPASCKDKQRYTCPSALGPQPPAALPVDGMVSSCGNDAQKTFVGFKHGQCVGMKQQAFHLHCKDGNTQATLQVFDNSQCTGTPSGERSQAANQCVAGTELRCVSAANAIHASIASMAALFLLAVTLSKQI